MKKVYNKDGSVDITAKREELSKYVLGSIISANDKEIVIRVRGSAENLKNVLIEKAILKDGPQGNRVYKNGSHILKDGEPCEHPGCLDHFSHPCEGCGRIGGETVFKVSLKKIRESIDSNRSRIDRTNSMAIASMFDGCQGFDKIYLLLDDGIVKDFIVDAVKHLIRTEYGEKEVICIKPF